jgi:GDP-D-mannose dehydratase
MTTLPNISKSVLRPWRPTKVQQDVLDRLRDGWELKYFYGIWTMEKAGEPKRFVAATTATSLIRRELVTFVPHTNGRQWGLVA